MEKNEVAQLSSELTYRQYLMSKGKIREVFRKMEIPEYIALHAIAEKRKGDAICEERTYLKDLAEKMHLTIRQTSKMVGQLNERGLLLWTHDGNGSEGTYVTITETGKKMLEEQEQMLREYFGTVIEKFGKEKLRELIQLMQQLESVMDEVMVLETE